MKGTVREKRPGYWEIRVDAGRDPVTGKRRQISRGHKGGKRDAEKAMRKLAQEVDAGSHASTSGTLGALLDAWVTNEGPTWSPTHYARVEQLIRTHIRPELGDKPLDRLKTSDLDAFYRRLERRLAPATVRKAHGVIRRALVQAVRWGWIVANPAATASPPVVPDGDINPPAPEAAMAVVVALLDVDPESATFYHLALATGIRRGEMCGIRRSDFDPEERTLLIRRAVIQVGKEVVEKGTKTHRHRRISLDAKASTLVAEQLERRRARAELGGVTMVADPYLFPSDKSLSGARATLPRMWTRRYRRLADKAGLEGVRLHDSRHLHATRLLGGGVDVRTVAGRLGHARASTTLDIYGHFLPALDREAADLMGELLAPAEHGAAAED